jgi:hypothetical protein
MKTLSDDTRKILDRLYNLRGKESIVLTKIAEEKEIASETKKRTEGEKKDLVKTITELGSNEKLLADQGAKLKDVLKSIKKDDFEIVLDKLDIDFDPDEIGKKVNDNLPGTIEKLANEKKDAEENLEKVEKEMNNAIATIEELGIRKDEALNNQSKLNEFFKLALSGNINITRDAITTLLAKFKFSEEEARDAAKILMFPEDGLYQYDDEVKNGIKTGKSISEVIAEAKESVDDDVVESQIDLNKPLFDLDDEKEIHIEPEETVIEPEEYVEPKEEVQEVEKTVDEDKIKEILTNNGLKVNDFSSDDIKKIMENYNESVIEENLKYIDKIGINKDIFVDNVEFIYDSELGQKIDKLISVGKVPFDIYLNPNILVKYNLSELNNAINSLMESGLDPKKIPLMAF